MRNCSIIIAEDFMILLSIMGRTTKEKNSEEIEVLNSSANQLDVGDMQKTPPNNRTHILLKCTWNVCWDRSYDRPQNKLVNLKRLKSYKVLFAVTIE